MGTKKCKEERSEFFIDKNDIGKAKRFLKNKEWERCPSDLSNHCDIVGASFFVKFLKFGLKTSFKESTGLAPRHKDRYSIM